VMLWLVLVVDVVRCHCLRRVVEMVLSSVSSLTFCVDLLSAPVCVDVGVMGYIEWKYAMQ
jgi:hypothetical protein